RAALERLGLSGMGGSARLPVRFLSQGQKRRAALARLVLHAERPLWILDEVFNALDAEAVRRVEALLVEHAARGGMAVFTSHLDLDLDGRTGDSALERLDLDDFDARRARPSSANAAGNAGIAHEFAAS